VTHPNSFNARQTLQVGAKEYTYYSLVEAEKNGLKGASQLPFSMKVLLENLLRFEDGRTVTKADIEAMAAWLDNRGKAEKEIAYRPARVLMQDFTGVPAVVDLAAMRDAMKNLGGDPRRINPQVPVDLVIDHSFVTDEFGTPLALSQNVELEYQRNMERYRFLKWGQTAFANFSVVPPGTGICHQVNLEFLSQTVWSRRNEADGTEVAYPDTLVGTDSHTTMVNGLAVLGWGVGGIEAEAAMLGQPVSMLIPEVIGFKLNGRCGKASPPPTSCSPSPRCCARRAWSASSWSSTARPQRHARGRPRHDRQHGPGIRRHLRLLPHRREDPAVHAHDEPHAGAHRARRGLCQGSRDVARGRDPDPVFTDTLELDLNDVRPSLAGPKRPQDRVLLDDAKQAFTKAMDTEFRKAAELGQRHKVEGTNYDLGHGDVVLAAITSCTNTSNPSVMIGAALLARNANRRGLKPKPWVKTSTAPGSQVVAEYFEKSGLQTDLDALGFNLVGFGCGSCIGNSGPLIPEVSKAVNDNDLVVCSVLSGNRNFEGRVNPDVRANYLASPPLVVAYALAGSMLIDLANDPLGTGSDGQPVYLKDIWPSSSEIQDLIDQTVTSELFGSRYADVFTGDERWRGVEVTGGLTFEWDMGSTYVQNPPYFEGMEKEPKPVTNIENARILGLFLDSITTDHISPAGNIRAASPAGAYLQERQVAPRDFNQYGTRRGNHEIMMRGTFANIRIKNQMVKDESGNAVEGGFTIHQPSGERMFIYDAAMRYQAEGVPLVVFAGKEYGTGSSRDWAAKGTNLLGIRAVIAESFERIHRSNLVGMGVVPLVFEGETSWQSLGLKGDEQVTIRGLSENLKPRQRLTAEITSADGSVQNVTLVCRIDTLDELEYFRNGGILHYVLRQLAA
jgi:aconitate hydratase